MAGDALSTTTQYFYKSPASNSPGGSALNDLLISLVQSIMGSGATNGVTKASAGNITGQLASNTPLSNIVSPHASGTDNIPKAYLSVLFFDERFNFVSEGSTSQRVSGADNSNAALTLSNIKAPKNGYAYIYVSNESDEYVYFDNFKVAHTRGRIIEENHYYAFGLKIAGISSKKLGDGNEGSLRNEYGYNDKELWEEGDLNWLDYGFRNYDPQIGRFLQIDPLSDEYEDLSPYLYAYNDPIANVDEDGLFASSALNAVGQAVNNTLPEVVVKSTIKKAVASKAKQSLLKTFFNKVAEELATTLENIGGAVLGATNAWTSNQVLGVGRMNPEASGFRGRLGTSVRIGMALGDAASIVTGGIEVGSSGIGLVLTGGVVTPLAVPVAIHGTTSMGLGVYHLVRGNIVYSSSVKNVGNTPKNNTPKKYDKVPPIKESTKLKNGQGWRDKDGNIWKKDMFHKDHWDVIDPKTGKKIKEFDYDGKQIWPDGPKNKNKK